MKNLIDLQMKKSIVMKDKLEKLFTNYLEINLNSKNNARKLEKLFIENKAALNNILIQESSNKHLKN